MTSWVLFAPRRPAAFPDDKIAMQSFAGLLTTWTFQPIQKDRHGALANLVARLADCGQGRSDVAGKGNVVKAYHRKIARHVKPTQAQGGDHANGGGVVDTKKGRRQRIFDK